MARIKGPQTEAELNQLVNGPPGSAAAAAPAAAARGVRVGDPCPQSGCLGRLIVLAVHVDDRSRNRTLACTDCKLAAGIERLPR